MARLGGTLNLREVAFAELAAEQIQRHSVDRPRGGSIVSSAFVPHECMSAVEFVPAEIYSSLGRLAPGLADSRKRLEPICIQPRKRTVHEVLYGIVRLNSRKFHYRS